ncbi:hypothetical protein [Actinospica sp.]|uniref:hypothetical protein n=1 Tax=Actinospica sp. TaxID=1872142 RepID=UPI002B670D0E|nr:hypothetical protein [Actinospica sp.]HWG23363.1 hypothetical protein [Actinospica sp.]
MIEDIADPAMPTTGVMVTTAGYQSGAGSVADTYGIVIPELREPHDRDVEGRLMGVQQSVRSKVARLSELHVDATALPATGSQLRALNQELEIETPDGRRCKVLDLLQGGELTAPPEAPALAHRVTRAFDQPAVLLVGGEPVAAVRSVSGVVRELPIDPFDVTVGGRERLAWMVEDTLGGERICWFTADGALYPTKS